MTTIAALVAQAARDLDEPFRARDILAWFATHAPEIKQTSIRAHIQALTGNATNRLDNAPVIGARPAVLYRLDHGLYRRWRPEDAVDSTPSQPTAGHARPPTVVPLPVPGEPTALDEWSWEGNIQSRVIAWLAGRGWRIRRAADTRSRERGTDIIADRAGRTLHVEVKGWPSARYVDPARSGEPKRTPPSLQARAWFADALLQGMRLRDTHPDDRVAIAMPDTPTYRNLAASVRSSLSRTEVTVLLVSENGDVMAAAPGNEFQ